MEIIYLDKSTNHHHQSFGKSGIFTSPTDPTPCCLQKHP
jgi:hypothetical protein